MLQAASDNITENQQDSDVSSFLQGFKEKVSDPLMALRQKEEEDKKKEEDLFDVSNLSCEIKTIRVVPAWCCSMHPRLIDSVLDDALRIVAGGLRPTPTDNLPVLTGIQPAELRHQGATLSLANRSSLAQVTFCMAS